jgi:flagellar biosynthetic protein FlhB
MKYDPASMAAPVVVAKGADLIALAIRKVAEEHDVAIVESPPLARALFAAVEVDQEIPQEHYRAVAEIISYVFQLKGRVLQN